MLCGFRNGSDAAYSYTYDDNGNITVITQGSTSITYQYDSANRLTRENNGVKNQTITYEYDVWGNILNKKVYAYTTGALGTPTQTIPYSYTNTTWGDQLTSYNNQSIVYDSMGNPTTYRGYAMTWRGKQLTGASDGTDSITYEYNEDGLRQRKSVNNVDTDYFYNGSVLIGMQQNNDVLRFSYDASGSVVSVNFNGTEYYYLRNAQGDIVKLIDASGATVVEYTYDTWGKKVTTTGSLASSLGLIQPFRYRGYVYDEETALYYLQSRYYDPTTGRFVSADVMLSTGQGVLGHNAYAYCLDNPVNMVDFDGDRPIIGAFNLDGEDKEDDDENEDPCMTFGLAVHKKRGTTNPANRNRHEEGLSRKNRDQNKTEKGDARRKHNKNNRRMSTGEYILGGLAIGGLVIVLIVVVADDATGVGAADDAAIPAIISGILSLAAAF